MKPIRWLIAVLLSISTMGSLALAQEQPIDDLDLIYLGFQSRKTFSGTGTIPQQDGYFVAIKFWLVGSSGVPDPDQPTAIYATAYLPTPTGTKPMMRVSFNGTRLLERTERFGPYYHVKRKAEPGETWITWYAHLGERAAPKSFAFESISSPDFRLRFPAAYKLVIADRAVLGSADLDVSASPLDRTLPPPSDAKISLFPSRVGTLRSGIYIGDYVPPNNPSLSLPRGDPLAGSGGWVLGSQRGLAGMSACNEQVMRFAGPDRPMEYVFRACTIVVKPVEIVIEQPR